VVVSGLDVPPLFFGAVRSAVVALAVLPWLLPMPRPYWRTVAVGLLMGGGGFGLMFLGLRTASPSAAAVVLQLGVPMATLLSVLMLGEHIRWLRGIGIALAFSGVVVVLWDPNGLDVSGGLLFIALSAFSGALGTILMKQMEGLRPLSYQAWVGFPSMLLLGLSSAAFEGGQVASAMEGGWLFAGLVLFSALLVSVFAHSIYFAIIQRYEANLVAPITLVSPLMAIGLGIWLTGDYFDLRMALGSVVALVGVLLIAVRPELAVRTAIMFRKRD
jgi:drug/metabolite transporter (DMT)-like permease